MDRLIELKKRQLLFMHSDIAGPVDPYGPDLITQDDAASLADIASRGTWIQRPSTSLSYQNDGSAPDGVNFIHCIANVSDVSNLRTEKSFSGFEIGESYLFEWWQRGTLGRAAARVWSGLQVSPDIDADLTWTSQQYIGVATATAVLIRMYAGGGTGGAGNFIDFDRLVARKIL